VPLALAVAGANVHDKWLVEPTLKSFAVRHPRPKKGGRKQHFCGDEAREQRSHPRYRARRWVVERSHSWMNRFRRLLIRWEKKVADYEAMLHLACAWITLRAAGVFG